MKSLKTTGVTIDLKSKLTHSMPSINGVSGQSFSGNRCKIFPLRLPDPMDDREMDRENSVKINLVSSLLQWMTQSSESVCLMMMKAARYCIYASYPYLVRLRHFYDNFGLWTLHNSTDSITIFYFYFVHSNVVMTYVCGSLTLFFVVIADNDEIIGQSRHHIWHTTKQFSFAIVMLQQLEKQRATATATAKSLSLTTTESI